MSNRRTFLKHSALGLTALPLTSLPILAAETKLPEKLTVVFQGDSITDAFRNRATYYPNNMQGMGNGYVHHIVTHLMGNYPTTHWQCYNRGISGKLMGVCKESKTAGNATIEALAVTKYFNWQNDGRMTACN